MRATHADSTHAEGKKHHEHIPVTTCTCTCCHCQIFHRQMVGMERRATSATAEAAAAIAALLAAIAAAAVPHSNSPPYLRLYTRYEHKMSSGLVLAKPAFILVQQNLQRTLHRRIHTHSTEYTAYIAQENACTLQRRILAFILVQQNLRCTFDKRIQGITIKQIYANSYVCP